MTVSPPQDKSQIEKDLERLTKIVEASASLQRTAIYEDVRRDGELENLCKAVAGIDRIFKNFMQAADKKHFPTVATFLSDLSSGSSNTGRALVQLKGIVEAQQKQIELLTTLVATSKAVRGE